MYYVDAPTVTWEFWTLQASSGVYVFTALFTATTYTLAGWAREQVCTFMCPWPRFQSAMLDDQSFTVTYQSWRGEPRHRGKTEGGDCIDCGACVMACPTGIDIRDGIQLECINCGLCMDACDHVMERTQKPRGLITWDTLGRQAAKQQGRHEPIRFIRPRTIIYLGALTIGVAAMGAALALRATSGLSVQRDRAPLFVRLPDGGVRNGYTVKIVNKTQVNAAYDLALDGLSGATLAVAEVEAKPSATLRLLAAADRVDTFRVLVTARQDGSVPLNFVLRDTATGQQTTYRSSFIGPGGKE